MKKVNKKKQKPPRKINKNLNKNKFRVSFKQTVVIIFLLMGFVSIHNALTSQDNLSSIQTEASPTENNSGKTNFSPGVAAATTPPKTPKQAKTEIQIPILMYHYIGTNPNPKDKARYSLSVTTETLDQEISYLVNHGYTLITMPTLFDILSKRSSSPPKPIVLTFDDGYIDFYTNAYPVFQKYQVKVVSFIPTGLIGKGYYMTWEQIREINASGLVDFEDHSLSHPNLTSLSPDKIREELKASKEILEKELDRPVNYIAYPGGATNYLVEQIARDLGYQGGVGTWGSIPAEAPGMDLPRIRMGGIENLDFFISTISKF